MQVPDYIPIGFDYMTEGREMDIDSILFLMRLLSDHENFYFGNIVHGLMAISTFYHFDNAKGDQRGRLLSACAADYLRAHNGGESSYASITDPNSASNLEIINAALNHGSKIWSVAERHGELNSLNEFMRLTNPQKRWTLAYMKTLDVMFNGSMGTEEMVFCFIVKQKNGSYEIGDGQAMEIKYAKAMMAEAELPLIIHLCVDNGTGKESDVVGRMQELRNYDAMEALNNLANVARLQGLRKGGTQPIDCHIAVPDQGLLVATQHTSRFGDLMPPTMNYEWHQHPLTLTNLPNLRGQINCGKQQTVSCFFL